MGAGVCIDESTEDESDGFVWEVDPESIAPSRVDHFDITYQLLYSSDSLHLILLPLILYIEPQIRTRNVYYPQPNN